MITSDMKKEHVRLFESWLSEATTEASDEEIKKLLNLLVPLIRKSVDDTMRYEVDSAKRLSTAKNDAEKTKIFSDLSLKRDFAEKPITVFLSTKAKVSQSQMNEILAWSKTMKKLLMDREMADREDEFKELGADVSRWAEMYNPQVANNQVLLQNREFERKTGIKPPLITG